MTYGKERILRKASSLIAFVFAAAGATAQNQFDSDLWGSNETPPVKNHAPGKASFDRVGNGIMWELRAEDIDGVVARHIHRGRVAGPIIVELSIPSPCEAAETGISCRGTIRRADLSRGRWRGTR